MPVLSFRLKLLLAMMLIVVGVTGATSFFTQQRVQATYQRLFEQQFRKQVEFFAQLQEARLSTVASRCQDFSESVRLRQLMLRVNTAIEDKDDADLKDATELLYQTVEDELREVLTSKENEKNKRANFFRVLGAHGEVLPPPHGVDIGLARGEAAQRLPQQLNEIAKNFPAQETQQVGHLAPETADGRAALSEVVFTKIIDVRSGENLGALVLGFPVPQTIKEETNSKSAPSIKTGLLLQQQLHTSSLSEKSRTEATALLATETRKKVEGDFPLNMEGEPHRVFFEKLNRNSSFPPSFRICFYSLREAQQEKKNFLNKILLFGGFGLGGALLFSLLLSHGLVTPIEQLVKGTGEIQRGNFSVKLPVQSRDEIGRLTASFNDMADGLAQKEKYRSVLNMVSDPAVAEELMRGEIALGGEVRQASILFCDIRGFTALTQNMPPVEVIQMLNEHMTALTTVVRQHGGVVDKFVGDLIMAIFGAPKSHGDDVRNAAGCALQMIEDRRKLNETSQHKIEMGIGVATGEIVAGCMGSTDRLNYTVLGERVNLAARLCSQAGRMEVVIDQLTKEKLANSITVETLPELKLKGFTNPVPAYKLLSIRS